MDDIASAAGVGRATVFGSVGGKAAILKAAYDIAIVGDDEPIPLPQRPCAIAVRHEPDPVRMIAAYAAFFLASRSDDLGLLSIVSFELLVNGILSSLLAVGSFAVLGRLFGILTTMHLLEMANPTQPLLRRLLMEAPGTYHHSIMVGNLAERAAEVIGADSLLVRVAAYYHDIGKLERPWAFIENQADTVANVPKGP